MRRAPCLLQPRPFTPLLMPANALAIVGTVRVAGWGGACCVARRVSDSAEIDIGFVNNVWDVAAIARHAGASSVVFPKWYDQSGNGRDYTQSTQADMPTFQPNKGWRGKFGGTCYEYPAGNGQFLSIPSGVSVSRQSCTVYSVSAPQASNTNTCTWSLGTTDSTRLSFLPASNTSDTVQDGTSSFVRSVTNFTNSQPTVNVVSVNGAEMRMHANERVSPSLAMPAAGTAAGGYFGASNTTASNFYGELFFHAVYGTGHDVHTVQGVKNQLYAAYDIATNVTKRVLWVGDSAVWGVASGSYVYPASRYLQDLFGERVDVRNIGVPGQTLATCLANITANEIASYARDYATNIVVLWAGSNDLFASQPAGGTTLGTPASTVTANLTSYAAQLQNTGYYVITNDVMARNNANSTNQSERVTFNTSHAGNTHGANGVVAVSSVLSDYTNTTLFTPDEVHPTLVGYQTVAALNAPALQAALGWTPAAVPALGVTPSTVPNARVWLNTADTSLTNVITEANSVAQFTDPVSGYSPTQPTLSTRPLLTRSLIGGRPGLAFRGTSLNPDNLIFPAGAYAIPNGDNTVFVVFQSANSGDATQYLLAGFTSGGGWRYGVALTATAIQVPNRSTSNSATSMAITRDTGVHVCGFIRSGTSITPFYDGVAGTPGTNSENSAVVASLLIGAQGSNRFKGNMGPVLIYNAGLSLSQANTVGSALAGYHGATWTGL